MTGVVQPVLLGLMGIVAGGVPLPAVEQRFSVNHPTEVPSFQRHVVPLLGRLGCNGRACHGSFQGQGGFRLSLFGYDFAADHAALVQGESPRVDPRHPEASLVLRKATRSVSHKGGQRIVPGSWQHKLLMRWIEGGAPGVRSEDAEFVSLEVQPREIVFAQVGQTVQLKVTAQWSDGSREDVTPLCRFRSNDDSTAAISESGLVTAAGKGTTAVVAFYDNGVVPVPVIVPMSDRLGSRYPAVSIPTKIDELVIAQLQKAGIVPSERCTDEEFLRRVSLDLTGTLPRPDEVVAFMADPSPDKRSRKVDELLERPSYAAWWTTRLCDWWGNSERTGALGGEQLLNGEKARQWYRWVYRRVRDNVPYDRIVEGVVLAVGRGPEQSYEDYCREMGRYFQRGGADFADRPTMPWFWARRTVGRPEDKALSFAHAFLGVSLQCAQCHKHPYDQWTKQDFDQFAAFFAGIRYGNGPRDASMQWRKEAGLAGLDEDSGTYKRKFAELAFQGKLLPFKDLVVPIRTGAKNVRGLRAPSGRVITPRLLGGEEVVASNYADPRQPLMDWMRHEDNPYFATAFVNRVWANYFGVGIIDPTDDLNLANPPSNPALLSYLSREFVRQGYDMKWLHRSLVTSDTYQRSWRPNPTNEHDERNFSRALIRRLPAEVAYDAIVLATASDAALARLHADPVGTRAIGEASGLSGGRGQVGNYAVQLFGKPPRVINCDCERSNEPSLLQTVYLRNDDEVQGLLDRADGWLAQHTAKGQSDGHGRKRPTQTKGRASDTPAPGPVITDRVELVRQAYLRTLSRYPNAQEAAIARRHLEEAPDLRSGLRELLWALINTKEFIVNR
ncbi:MAG: DUF1549 domain-containing protein [Gemmataceae bacterium]|nr:DUF1549 domain-containing protein [Gemmataceae bacterium]